jgi:hypothetical protein
VTHVELLTRRQTRRSTAAPEHDAGAADLPAPQHGSIASLTALRAALDAVAASPIAQLFLRDSTQAELSNLRGSVVGTLAKRLTEEAERGDGAYEHIACDRNGSAVHAGDMVELPTSEVFAVQSYDPATDRLSCPETGDWMLGRHATRVTGQATDDCTACARGNGPAMVEARYAVAVAPRTPAAVARAEALEAATNPDDWKI